MNAATDKKRKLRLFLRKFKPLLYLLPFLTGVAVFSARLRSTKSSA